MNKDNIDERFWSKVDANGVCWEWTGFLNPHGYGKFRSGDVQLAHRFAYETLVGPIPTGANLDHICRNRACVCPEHLEPITQRENVLRGSGLAAQNARKKVCVRGHELSGDNLRINPKSGARVCKQCERERCREYRQRQKTKGQQQ
jgi:hypothetical protein